MTTADAIVDPAGEESPARRTGPWPVRLIFGIEDAVMALLLVAVFVVVLIQVASRFIFHAPLSWTTEVSVTIMIWLAFIGLAVGIRDKAHVSFELLEDRVSEKYRILVGLVQAVVLGFFLVIVGYGGIGLVQLGLGQLTPAGLPQWIAFSAVPAGCALGLLHLAAIEAQAVWSALRGRSAPSADLGKEA